MSIDRHYRWFLAAALVAMIAVAWTAGDAAAQLFPPKVPGGDGNEGSETESDETEYRVPPGTEGKVRYGDRSTDLRSEDEEPRPTPVDIAVGFDRDPGVTWHGDFVVYGVTVTNLDKEEGASDVWLRVAHRFEFLRGPNQGRHDEFASIKISEEIAEYCEKEDDFFECWLGYVEPGEEIKFWIEAQVLKGIEHGQNARLSTVVVARNSEPAQADPRRNNNRAILETPVVADIPKIAMLGGTRSVMDDGKEGWRTVELREVEQERPVIIGAQFSTEFLEQNLGSLPEEVDVQVVVNGAPNKSITLNHDPQRPDATYVSRFIRIVSPEGSHARPREGETFIYAPLQGALVFQLRAQVGDRVHRSERVTVVAR